MPRPIKITRRAALGTALLSAAAPSMGWGQGPQKRPVTLEAPVQGLLGIGPVFSITRVDPDGSTRLKVSDRADPVFAKTIAPLFSEGYFLLFAPRHDGSGRFDVVRARITEVAEGPEFLVATSAEAASRLKVGEGYTLVRPIGATTAILRDLPDVIPVAEPPGGLADGAKLARRAMSVNHLKQIGLAMHNYHATYNRFPAAVIHGPDGRPWHSWRVLILPYLEEAALFNEYDFNQPWDSEKNRKLIDRMPEIYREPAYGNEKGSTAHYAALVGEKAFFPPEGARQVARVGATVPMGLGGRGIAEVTDGTSNTVMVAPVDPARKIPWTKPEDINVGPDFPGLGKPGGIATPYTLGGRPDAAGVAPILFADGHVQLIAATIDPQVLAAILTYNGGEVVSADAIPADAQPNQQRPQKVVIRVDGKQVKATIE